jgi:hypothetical protein
VHLPHYEITFFFTAILIVKHVRCPACETQRFKLACSTNTFPQQYQCILVTVVNKLPCNPSNSAYSCPLQMMALIFQHTHSMTPDSLQPSPLPPLNQRQKYRRHNSSFWNILKLPVYKYTNGKLLSLQINPL